MQEHEKELSIRGRIAVPDILSADLVKLPLPTSLWTFIAELWSHVEEFHRMRPALHAVFYVGTGNRGSVFRTQS